MKTTATYFLALILFSVPAAYAQRDADPHPHRGHQEGPLLFDYTAPGGSRVAGQHFAMPGRSVMPLMAAGARPGGSYLGIHIVEVDDKRAGELKMAAPHGVEVSNVAEDSPAAKGGLQKGDVVAEFDGQRVRGVEHFVRLVRETPVGRSVAMSIVRDGEPINLTAEVGRRKAARREQHFVFCDGDDGDCTSGLPNVDFFRKQVSGIRHKLTHMDMPRPRIVMQNRYLGAELESVEGQLADYFGVEQGVLVRAVDADTPGKRAGLRAGDVITSVNDKSVDSPSELRQEIQRADPPEEVKMAVKRKSAEIILMLEPREREDIAGERYIKGRRVRTKPAKPL